MSIKNNPYPDTSALVNDSFVQVGLFKIFDTKERKDLLNTNLKDLTDAINSVFDLPEYANDAAAGSAGLTAGQLYHLSTGEVMVKL